MERGAVEFLDQSSTKI